MTVHPPGWALHHADYRDIVSQQTTELNEKLHECYRKLREAEAETRETQRETKLKEVIASLQRIFPAGSVKGRVSDLCKPVQRKYDKAISVALGKNIDSIVVDTQQTAMDCVNVSVRRRFLLFDS